MSICLSVCQSFFHFSRIQNSAGWRQFCNSDCEYFYFQALCCRESPDGSYSPSAVTVSLPHKEQRIFWLCCPNDSFFSPSPKVSYLPLTLPRLSPMTNFAKGGERNFALAVWAYIKAGLPLASFVQTFPYQTVPTAKCSVVVSELWVLSSRSQYLVDPAS